MTKPKEYTAFDYFMGAIVWLVLILFSRFGCDNSAEGAVVDVPLRTAIEQHESGGRADALGDWNKKTKQFDAVGILQIHKGMVDDVNRITKAVRVHRPRFRYADRFSVRRSREIYRIFCEHYSRGCSREVIARRWNGGPDGDKRASTYRYWKSIAAKLAAATASTPSCR